MTPAPQSLLIKSCANVSDFAQFFGRYVNVIVIEKADNPIVNILDSRLLTRYDLKFSLKSKTYDVFGFRLYLFRRWRKVRDICAALLMNTLRSCGTLEDGERLTKIILFKKEISIDYKDGKGNKISKSKYNKFVNQGKAIGITKTTVIKRYQGKRSSGI